jgi:hypothetical protein
MTVCAHTGEAYRRRPLHNESNASALILTCFTPAFHAAPRHLPHAASISQARHSPVRTLPDASARCRLANLGPLGPDVIRASYNSGRASYTKDGEMVIGLVGTDGGRFATADGDALHGMFQWDAQPSGAPGAITGAYLRSDYDQETQQYSEIE